MTIPKRHVDVEDLLGLYLNFVPQPAQADLFRSDMRVMNPILLKDAIKECAATRGAQQVRHMEHRKAIQRVYARKTKELAALYPFIFSVENALRLAAAEHYGETFGGDSWWTVIRDKVGKGLDETCFAVDVNQKKNIRGIAVNPKFVEELFYSIGNMPNSGWNALNDPNTNDELYLHLSLGSLFNLIDADWEISRGMFLADQVLGRRLRKNDIKSAAYIVKSARNELFHGKPIGDVSKVARACENILDKVGFHMGEFDTRLSESQITRPQTAIARKGYHLYPATDT